MHPIDWAVVAAYLVWIVHDGLKRTKGSDKVEGYFLANRSLPWWAVGLSVMATQLSAITLVGTTGQGYRDGLRFVQFYFGLPLAMLILSVTVVPFFHRANVYTAYEYLEGRFDAKTRALTSLLFLLSRGLSCGVIIAAPAVILSIVLDWNLTITVLAIGLPTAIYTMLGGVQAVTWTDVKQMAVIVAGVAAAVVVLVLRLPAEVSVSDALHIAGSTGRLQALDFRVHPHGDLHVLVGPDRRALPDAVVLRLRSEPGAALPHGEVAAGGPAVADDERLREDPVAGADSPDRRARVRVLPVHAPADAVQSAAREGGARQPRRRRVRRPRSAVQRHVRRAPEGSARRGVRPAPRR